MSRSSSGAARRGRPRDPDLDRRILDAALDQMREVGYAGMSVEQVARAAGVPKPTLYRRWASKPDLATAALARLQSQEPPPRGGTARDEVLAILREFGRNLTRPHGLAMIGTLLAEETRHPELIELFRTRIVDRRRAIIRDALKRGRERGELRDDVDLEAVTSLLVGSFYGRHLTGKGIPRTWASRVVATVWRGIEAT